MHELKESVDKFVIVIVGAAGDLSKRKLLPALFELDEQGWLPSDYKIVCTSRSSDFKGDKTLDEILSFIKTSKQALTNFKKHIILISGFEPKGDGTKLTKTLKKLGPRRKLFYAATPSDQFSPLAALLAKNNLMDEHSSIILEKPLGRDLQSYLGINEAVAKHVKENQLYRIDHYLGKETVQNLLCLRFANLIFESIWNRSFIDHIQITVSESVGAGTRASYYDTSGVIRDMVQNHMAQLLCLTAMEPPQYYDANSVRDEKLKVLSSLSPIEKENVVLGQYKTGLVDGNKVKSYRQELNNPKTDTATFVAMKVEIDNWRWAGVPFYLRTGKCMPVRDSQIVIRFKKVPHMIFHKGGNPYNQIVIRLQPNEGVELHVNTKIPGPGGLRLESNILNLNFSDAKQKMPDAYERLLLDALRDNATLYMRHDEVQASWQWIEPALNFNNEVELYNAGTWGPDSSQLLLAKSDRRWVNPNIPE